MSEMIPHVGICYEGVPKTIRSYVTNTLDVAITQVAIEADGITYTVDQYDSKEKAEADTDATAIQVSVTAGSVASLVFDSLQTWPVDTVGFNFQMVLPAASFPTKAKWYVVEVWINPVSGEDFLAGIWIFECLATRKD